MRVQGRSLYERLELVTWVSRGALKTENAFDWCFFHDWVTKTVSNVRELHVFGPVNVVFRSLTMVIMLSNRSVIEIFLKVNLLGL